MFDRYFNYQSPIELVEINPLENIVEKAASDIAKQIDCEIFTAVRRVAVNVNEEELRKALAYDRDQYEKGYADGLKNADIVYAYWDKDPMTGFMKCSDCGTAPPGDAELEDFYEET